MRSSREIFFATWSCVAFPGANSFTHNLLRVRTNSHLRTLNYFSGIVVITATCSRMRCGCIRGCCGSITSVAYTPKTGMGKIPISASLSDLEAVGKSPARRDAVEAHAWDAIHRALQDDAVPVDRSLHFEAVGHGQGHHVAFAPAQRRAGYLAVDYGVDGGRAGEIDRQFGNSQVEFMAGKLFRLGGGPDWNRE